jgi:RNA polymerase sigma factor (sigma-70 family)
MEEFIRTLTKAQQGDKTALEEIFSLFADDVRFACLGFQLEQTADLSRSDLLQEAWVKIWVKLGRFQFHGESTDSRQQFRLWLRQIARNEMINVLEKRLAKKRRPATPMRNGEWLDAAVTGDSSPSHQMRLDEEMTSLKTSLKRLDATSRAVIEACFMEGCTVKAMSEKLGLTYAEGRSRLSKALAELRSDIDDSNH